MYACNNSEIRKPINIYIIMTLLYYDNIDHSVKFTQSCPTLCAPMDCSTPGLPVHHQLPEFTQIHVHWVGDAIQPSHPLSSPSPPAFNLSQYQGLFKWVSSSSDPKKWFHLRNPDSSQWSFYLLYNLKTF